MRPLFILASVVFILGAGIVQAAENKPTIAEPKLTGKLILGKLAYGANCAECHGKLGGGTDKGPPFLHQVYHPGHHGDAAFFRAAKNGTRAHHWPFGDMPPVPKATEAQVANIVKYIRALQKENGLF